MRLANKIALVVGGATGIGRSIALRFAQEGAQVAIADINSDDGQKTALAIQGHFVYCDSADSTQARRAVNQTVATYGRLDILINAAAHLGGMNIVADMPESEWRTVLNVTLDGVFHCSKYAVAKMLSQGSGGSIIHIASVEGMTGVAGHAAYVTAKSALFGLTRSMAIDYGPHNIRINAISPGIIDSGSIYLLRPMRMSEFYFLSNARDTSLSLAHITQGETK